LDIVDSCEFEEIAHLLVHGKLPNLAELKAYTAKLKALRGLSASVKAALECLPAASHPMDVMRTGVSVLGCVLPEKDDHNLPGARDIADKLMASLGSMLLYWYHYSQNGKRIEVETDDDSIGGHFLHLLHGVKPSASWEKAMHTSLILYAEHEFNASTFTGRVIAGTGSDMFSAIAGAIGALRGPKHGGANEVAFEIQKRYENPDEAEADIKKRVENKEVVIGFGHPV
ncbi:MAG: 2-methylcitrate synthase, partial [Glaciimonas sp.]|nr:2-methylcitrate synthase [Glaciimonas sp.]